MKLVILRRGNNNYWESFACLIISIFSDTVSNKTIVEVKDMEYCKKARGDD